MLSFNFNIFKFFNKWGTKKKCLASCFAVRMVPEMPCRNEWYIVKNPVMLGTGMVDIDSASVKVFS